MLLALAGTTLVSALGVAGWKLWGDGDITGERIVQKAQRELGKPRGKGQPRAYGGDLPSMAGVNIRNAIADTVYRGLAYPWAFEFTPSGDVLVTEFRHGLSRLDLSDGSRRVIEGMPEFATGSGQLGMMDIALHPDFASNGVIYLSHALEDPDHKGRYATAVTRAELADDRLRNRRLIFLSLPYEPSNSNLGGALAFGPDGLLYIGTGDRSRELRSQDGTSLNGKIIRLTAEGEVPADNPFIGTEGVDDRIYALGVRNPQGLVFDSATGALYESEHGPMGGDEVNLILPGHNYGWPIITYGANYNTQKKGVGTSRQGLEQPLYYYLPSIATSPLTQYRGDMFPEWDGHLMVGALKGAHVSLLDLQGERVISQQAVLNELQGRVRDIKIASDGAVYVLLQNGGRLVRLYRDFDSAEVEQSESRKGGVVYSFSCAGCHSSGSPGVPQLIDTAAWESIARKGVEQLLVNTRDGYGAMPPRGLCDNCSDAELLAAVRFMLQRALGDRVPAASGPQGAR
jgi:glucose/arabinose dehydrogenase